MSILHQSMCIFKASLSSLYDGWAKYKEKVPDVSDPNQIVRARSSVVSDLRSETKGSRFEAGCCLCAEISSLQ